VILVGTACFWSSSIVLVGKGSLLNSVNDLTTFLACSILSFIINHLRDSGTNLENVRINVNQETTKTKLMVRVLNLTFNYISAISWRSVLLVEETGVSWENYRLRLKTMNQDDNTCFMIYWEHQLYVNIVWFYFISGWFFCYVEIMKTTFNLFPNFFYLIEMMITYYPPPLGLMLTINKCKLLGHINLLWLSCLGTLIVLIPQTFKLFGIPIIWPWAYLKKFIPETCCAH
jgi:magnesium-transporting ATPase (P-type)